jgi:hypothetical protein
VHALAGGGVVNRQLSSMERLHRHAWLCQHMLPTDLLHDC